ncbi:DUF4258 domain-containing protein [Xanthobacter autotrophicus]|uniref:DUF4258 domain-containing protein n=1 Tax=Xanthobacter autotrophicus TaxID=280 RepID=UPI00372C2EAF
MTKGPVRLSRHAEVAAREREIERDWIERAIVAPDWEAADDGDPSLRRVYVAVPERGGRILRVVYREDELGVFVVTVFLDRGARRP